MKLYTGYKSAKSCPVFCCLQCVGLRCKDVECSLFVSTCSYSSSASPEGTEHLTTELQRLKSPTVLMANKTWVAYQENCNSPKQYLSVTAMYICTHDENRSPIQSHVLMHLAILKKNRIHLLEFVRASLSDLSWSWQCPTGIWAQELPSCKGQSPSG